MDYQHNPKLSTRAKEPRKNMTKEERRLWHCFLKKLYPRFLRQKIVDNYIVDLYCAEAKLVVELDGSQHFDEAGVEYDKKRTEALKHRGLRVLRIPNSETSQNFEGICLYIEKMLNESPRP